MKFSIWNIPKALFIFLSLATPDIAFAQSPGTFTWPEGKQMALSLTFDDARAS